MYSTARKLSTVCAIFSAFNITGLVMLAILSMNLPKSVSFGVFFTCAIYAISTTVIAFLLTLAVRSFVQDANLDSENTAMRLKNLTDRVNVLESKK